MGIIIFTHKDSIDGLATAIVGKAIYGDENCKIVFTDQDNVNDAFINEFQIKTIYDYDNECDTYNVRGNAEIKKYDKVYVVGLCIDGDVYEKLIRAGNINPKFHMFDHHDTIQAAKAAGCPILCDIQSEIYGKKVSSTSLFYDYILKRNYDKSTKALSQFVELSRIKETGDNLDNYRDKEILIKMADDLEILRKAIGDEIFCKLMLFKLTEEDNEHFMLTDKEKKIIEKYKLNNEEPNC